MGYYYGRLLISQVLLSFSILIVYTRANYVPHHVSHSGIRSADVVSPRDFADELFEKYGSNGSMDVGQLKTMLNNLGIGKDNNKVPKDQGTVNERCFSTSSVLDVFSINKTTVNKQNFNQICPAIVQQIDSQVCNGNDKDSKTVVARESKAKAWGFGFLAVFIISCASLFGAFVVPFMSKEFYKKLLLFMVSLAVGVLGGSGIFHLIPSTFGYGDDGDYSYLYKCCVIIGGIYFFFCMEYIMKMYVRFKGDKGISIGHGHSHNLSSNKNSQDQIPSNGIAEAQLRMYNVMQDHHSSHTESFCISNNYFPKQLDVNGLASVCSKTNVLSNSDQSVDFKDPQNTNMKMKEKKSIAPVAWMIIIGDGVHNFIDGLAIGAGFSTSTLDGISTSLAIFCEELPHELGDFAVLLNAGMSYKQALLCNFLSACLCFLGLVIGLLLGYSTSAVKWIYALAGGMFLYISLVDMLQEATEMSCKEGEGSVTQNLKTFALQAFGMLFGFAVMFVLALYTTSITV